MLAGLGHLAFSSAVIAVTALLLIEKSRVHALVDRMDDTAVRAGIRFAVMAVVLMPLLPTGPYGPLGGVRPRELWVFVLFFSGISFAGYIARLFVGARHGYLVAGLLGGIVSSTSVTLSFSRASRREDESVGRPLAYGVLAACTTLFVRVGVATAVLSLPLALRLLPLIAAPFVVGVAAVLIGMRRPRQERPEVSRLQNPLQFGAALQMAALFQAVLFAVEAVRTTWGDVGLVVSGAILGLADVDALMISDGPHGRHRRRRGGPGHGRRRGHPVEHAVQARPGDVALPPAVQANRGAGPGRDGRRVAGRAPGVPPDALTSRRTRH